MGTYAIVNDRGRRFTARPGEEVWIDYRADLAKGATITFDQVELLSTDGGIKVGTPTVSGAKVVAEVKGETRGKKITVFKYRRRKSSRRKHGSRAFYTCVAIQKIG
ncbi:MAG: 50S ribosomal protein L21 [Planctomycetes bacterium]|nr:50S ribosomal protein L21 [Planctomycetota bacterium]